MAKQKCIITFEDGTGAVYVGDVQFDAKRPKRVKRVQFTVPEVDEDVERLMGMFGMR